MTDSLHTKMWNDCLALIRDIVPAEQYDAWFKDITSLRYEDDKLELLVPSRFFAEQLEIRYISVMAPVLKRVYGENVKLFYNFEQVQGQPDTQVRERSEKPSVEVTRNGLTAPQSNPFMAPETGDIDSQLNPRYTFENYCEGESNKIVMAIAQTIAKDPMSRTFNPMFIFGPVGVGKTHLMQAIGIRIKEKNPRQRILYITARLFESQYVAAVAKKLTNSFFRFYQSIDTLLIDDIQDLQNKPGTQNIFYHIFNHLHQNNKQIIMSCDRAPAEMEGFEERLLSRFKWGTAAELQRPDIDLRREVLKRKAQTDGVELPDEVCEYIAASVSTSIRELEGIMASLLVHAIALNSPITLELAQSIIGKIVKVETRPVNFDLIAQEVSNYYNIEPKSLFSKTRKREVSDARQILMYLARTIAKLPIVEIGKQLLRTHATVNYACNIIEDRMKTDAQLRNDITRIQAAVVGA